MIDFRLHLISLVAVFLALGLGVLMGSVVLDQELTERLQDNVKQLQRDKAELQDDVIALENRIDADVGFAEVAEDWLLTDALEGRKVVLLHFSGTDDRVTDGVREAVEAAGGELATDIALTEKLRLPSEVERDQLALAVESTAGTAAELRKEGGELLGTRLASAALSGGREGRLDAADTAAKQLLDGLAESGFIDINRSSDGDQVPRSALFVLAGGSVDARPFDVTQVALPIAEAIAERGSPVLVAESFDSKWALVSAIRTSENEDRISTVDDAEAIAGRIAIGLALAQAVDGSTGHYGIGTGAGDVIPKPSPGD